MKYKYLNEFYKAAYINPQNIVLQDINYFGNMVSIYIVEQNDNTRIIKADGDKDKLIKWSNIKDMILNKSQFKELKRIGGVE
ncbi:hypothetical protein ACSVC9_12100 [Clostridium sp. LBM24168]